MPLQTAYIIIAIIGTSNVKFSYAPPNISKIISPPFLGGTMQVIGTDFVDKNIVITIYENGCSRSCLDLQFVSDNVIQCQYNGIGQAGVCDKQIYEASSPMSESVPTPTR